jgi:multidrug efflux pump
VFARFFIDHPIFAAVLSIVIVLGGGLAVMTLPIAQYPEVSPPTIEVSAIYPGASAQVVAETVSIPVEQEVNGVENMLYMESQCTNDGRMTLTITFKVGTNLDMAQVLVQNRVSLAMPKLPDAVKQSGVSTKKKSPSIILCVNLLSPDGRYDQLYLSNYASRNVKDALARLPGVGDVSFLGELEYSMRVWLDPERVAARDLTAGDVVRSIREQNVQVAAGQIGQPPVAKDLPFQYTMSTEGRLVDEEQFRDIIIKSGKGGQVTRLRDVARVELGGKSADVTSSLDGKPTITLAVYQLPGSNALDTAQGIRSELDRLSQRFPAGLTYKIVYDTTPFISESIHEVTKSLRDAIILVAIVVLVFLQSWRAAIIPLAAVPVSLIGTFAVMAGMGFSLNNLSLFGLVLAIGIVVDDAIVVVENVEHHLAHGLSPRDATRRAMDEVAGPVIAVALVLCAVFIPTAFISGITGQFFRQFALTIAVSTAISAFNSLTLSPALSAILLKPKTATRDPLTRLLDLTLGWFFKGFNGLFDFSTSLYAQIVSRMLRLSAIVLLVYGGLLYLTYVGFTSVPGGFIPTQDKGYLVVDAQLPDAASLSRTQKAMTRVDELIRSTEGVAHTVGIQGMSIVSNAYASNLGTLFVVLEDFDQRKKSGVTADTVAAALRAKFAPIQEAQFNAFGAPPVDGLGNASGFKIQIQDRSSVGPAALQKAVEDLVEAGDAEPRLDGMYTAFRSNTPQLSADVDRSKAKAMGVPLDEVFDALQIYLGSLYVNDVTLFGRNYQVNVQADSQFRSKPEDVGRLKVRNNQGEMLPLGTLLDVRNQSGPSMISRYNMYPAAAVNGGTAPGVSSGDAITIVERLAKEKLPASMGYEWTELTLLQIQAGNTAMIVFALAVVLVFLVLAAQYESWTLPLAVILVVPMCLLCSVIGVALAHLDINIFTQIGLVVLVGLASKNAILIVEFAKARREAGVASFEATVEACRMRLRPIMMTSFAFILGVVPLVIAQGAGAEMRRTLGIAVFSGMLGVTLFGIFLTPVFYYVIQRLADRRQPIVTAAKASATES